MKTVPDLVAKARKLYDKGYQLDTSLTNFQLVINGEERTIAVDYRAANGEVVPALNFTQKQAELYAAELKRMKEVGVKLNEPVSGLAKNF